MMKPLFAFAIASLVLVACQGRNIVAAPTIGGPRDARPFVVQGGGQSPNWAQIEVLNYYGLSDIVSGPEGSLWIGDGRNDYIWRVSPSGKMAHFAIPGTSNSPRYLTTGPNQSIWFTTNNGSIGRLSRAGGMTVFSLPYPNQTLNGIILGPDGNLWFAQYQGRTIAVVDRISPTGKFLSYFTLPTADAEPTALIRGSDGNVWVAEPNNPGIARVTPTGQVTEFDSQALNSNCIAPGPDGNIWWVTGSYVGNITPTGAVTQYVLLGGNGQCIAEGPDKHLWVTTVNQPMDLVRVATDGTQQFFQQGIPNVDGDFITTGPDGNIWFSEFENGNQSGTIGVYIRKVLKVSPTSVTFQTIGQQVDLSATEKNFKGNLTASTSNAAVATVANDSSKDTFVVTAVSSGTATITVADNEKNTYPVPVTVP